jgi:hypothetical protein
MFKVGWEHCPFCYGQEIFFSTPKHLWEKVAILGGAGSLRAVRRRTDGANLSYRLITTIHFGSARSDRCNLLNISIPISSAY